jgi:hypothetical protein
MRLNPKMKGIKTRFKTLTLGKRHSRRECLGPEALRASVPLLSLRLGIKMTGLP